MQCQGRVHVYFVIADRGLFDNDRWGGLGLRGFGRRATVGLPGIGGDAGGIWARVFLVDDTVVIAISGCDHYGRRLWRRRHGDDRDWRLGRCDGGGVGGVASFSAITATTGVETLRVSFVPVSVRLVV